jgi:hypothetical protein
LEVLVPKELGFEGAELDECRLHRNSKDGWVYLTLNSHNYKRNCIDYSLLSKGDWDAFFSMSRASFCKFVGFGWIKPYEVKDLLDDFKGQATESGVPFRMYQRRDDLRPGYVYASVKGYLMERRRQFYKVKRLVSFEDIEDFYIEDTV